MSGATFDAMSTSTQSWNDAASTMPVPNRCHAHAMAADAGLCSSSADAVASSARSTSKSGRSTRWGSKRLMIPALGLRPGRSGRVRCSAGYPPPYAHSCRRALPVADVGDIRTGLVVVDVEVGADVGSRERVEVFERVADALGAAGTR